MANPYLTQQGLLTPQQAALLGVQQPLLPHSILTPQQQLTHSGLLSQHLLQQSLAGAQHHTNSLLGTPPVSRPGALNPALLSRALLTQAVLNNQLKPKVAVNRVPYKLPVKPKLAPLKPEETLTKLEKLATEFENVEKFAANAKEFEDLLTRGLSKETTTKFFELLQKLSGFIGSPETNAVALGRLFDGAYTKRGLFTTEEAASLTNWKTESDKLKTKRPLPTDDSSDSNKKQKYSANGTAVEGILLKRIDTLEEEVTKLKEELSQTKLKYGKELAQIRAAVFPTGFEEEISDSVLGTTGEEGKQTTTTTTTSTTNSTTTNDTAE